MHADGKILPDIIDEFRELKNDFLEISLLFGFNEMQLLRLLLLNHSPLQYPISIEVPVGTAMSMKKELITRLHIPELKIPILHPKPILQHLMKYHIPLNECLYRLIYCKLPLLFLPLLQLIV